MATQWAGDGSERARSPAEGSSWETLADLTRALLHESDEEAVAQVFLVGLPRVLPVSFAAVSLSPHQKRGYWRALGHRDGRPLSARLLDRIAGLSQRELGREVLALAPPLMGSSQALVVDPQRFGLSEINPGPILAAALTTGRDEFGFLLAGKGSQSTYSPDEHVRLCLLANQLASALETAALYSDTLHRDRELALIYQTGQRITQLLDLSELMAQLVTAVSQTFGYESVTLLLVDERRNELVVKETYGLRREAHLGFRVPVTDALEGGIVGWVAYHGKPYLAPDVRREKRYLETVKETRSEISVPLRIKGRVIGVLDVQSTAVGGVTEKDRHILETLADQIAVALENARLYEDLARAHGEIQQTARQLQRLLERTVRIQEQERRRIAADIHDDVSQLLYAALYEAEAALQALSADQAEARQNLQNVHASLTGAATEMRKAIFDLWPTSLDEMGLLPSVQAYLGRFQKTAGISCQLNITGVPIPFSPLARITIYRILQEALHNVHKHAQATHATVSLSFRRSKVWVSIGDDGEGFDVGELPAKNEQHLGLVSMRERARSIGGDFHINSKPGSGTLLLFEFPTASVREERKSE